MTLNLVQHRAQPNVWDRVGERDRDTERWLAAIAAGACFIAGTRRRSPAGWLLLISAGTLAWWAASRADVRLQRRERVRRTIISRGRCENSDVVSEASEESFPASDAPAWTPTTANTSVQTNGAPTRR